ncbi:hypothetical protein [Qipengyuania sp. MTN3-11]|uniref:hypothetical protein n=1 Tax=Qipengyuania sp. MTN3-11 TaxID=3056557 RepID=UPI0036F3FD1A
MRSAFFAAMLMPLAACGAEKGEPAPVEDRPAEQVDRQATAEHEAIGSKANMVLTSTGFTYRVAGGTTNSKIDFDIRRETVERIARQQFGEPTGITTNEECGAGPMSFTEYGPLTFNFQDGRLVGWYLEAGGELTTADGVKPGTTSFADIENERSANMVEDSMLVGEFSYAAADGGEIGGFVDEEGTVTSLYTGTNCFFR